MRLENAKLYEGELNQRLYETWYDPRYQWYWGGMWRFEHSFGSVDSPVYAFAVLDNDNQLLGFIRYEIDIDSRVAHRFGAINFTEDKATFAGAIRQVISDCFLKFGINVLEWHVIIGNPIERSYDRICERMGGRIVGTKRDRVRDLAGNLHDEKWYEIHQKDFLKAMEEGFPPPKKEERTVIPDDHTDPEEDESETPTPGSRNYWKATWRSETDRPDPYIIVRADNKKEAVAEANRVIAQLINSPMDVSPMESKQIVARLKNQKKAEVVDDAPKDSNEESGAAEPLYQRITSGKHRTALSDWDIVQQDMIAAISSASDAQDAVNRMEKVYQEFREMSERREADMTHPQRSSQVVEDILSAREKGDATEDELVTREMERIQVTHTDPSATTGSNYYLVELKGHFVKNEFVIRAKDEKEAGRIGSRIRGAIATDVTIIRQLTSLNDLAVNPADHEVQRYWIVQLSCPMIGPDRYEIIEAPTTEDVLQIIKERDKNSYLKQQVTVVREIKTLGDIISNSPD